MARCESIRTRPLLFPAAFFFFFFGFRFCFFALLGEPISRGVSFVHLLRSDQLPSVSGRSLGGAVLLKTVGAGGAPQRRDAERGAGRGSWAGAVLLPEPAERGASNVQGSRLKRA